MITTSYSAYSYKNSNSGVDTSIDLSSADGFMCNEHDEDIHLSHRRKDLIYKSNNDCMGSYSSPSSYPSFDKEDGHDLHQVFMTNATWEPPMRIIGPQRQHPMRTDHNWVWMATQS